MRNQQLFEAPFVSEIGRDDCSKYVSTQWNSRYHWRFCQGTPCIDSNGRQSICIRPGAGKCICKRCQGEAPPPFSPNFEAAFPTQIAHYAASTQENPGNFEALFEFEDLTREQMASFLQDKWNRYPVLRRLAKAQGLRGQALYLELISILRSFQQATGITVQAVPEGTVRRLTKDPRNFSSLRSQPGFYQIEQQVLQNPSQLLKEVRHELAYHYAGGPGNVPVLRGNDFNALQLLEFMIQRNGQLPPPVAPISSQDEAEVLLESETPTNPWPRRLAKAREMLNNARRHLATNNLRGFDAALTSAIVSIDQAEAGIRSRISQSPRLARVTVETTSAKHAIQTARKNRTNPVRAENELKKATRSLLAARAAIGLNPV